MRDLAAAQAKSGRYAAVGLGVIHSRNWPDTCEQELQSLGLPVFKAGTLKAFGTAQFLWQRVQKPAIDKWVRELAEPSHAKRAVVHFHNAWMSGVFLPLPLVEDVPVAAVATFHGVNAFLDRQPLRHRLHRWMARRLVQHGAALTSVDGANPALAEAMLGLPAKRFKVVANGVTPASVQACPFLRDNPRLTVGHVGSLIPQKGWQIAAQGVIAAAQSGAPCRMIIAGSGPDEAAARALARQHPAIIEFRGFVPNPRQNLMPELDLLAVMSLHEGLPMSAVEALSVGLPVAGTNVGGMAEVVDDGKTGFLVERSAAALERVIVRLAGDRVCLRRLAEASRRLFADNFDISRVVEAYHQVYLSALAYHDN